MLQQQQRPAWYASSCCCIPMQPVLMHVPCSSFSLLPPSQARKYVVKEGASLVPQPLGRLLVGLLVGHLGRYVEVGFTSDMENNLDEVSGERDVGRGVRGGGRVCETS